MNILRYVFPYARLTLSTSHSPLSVLDKLKQVVLVKEHPVFRLAHRLPQHEFSGSFNGYSFRIRRIHRVVKYSLPLIIGEYEKNGLKTEIKMLIRLHWVHYAFLLLFLVFCVLSFLPLPKNLINTNRESQLINCLLVIIIWATAYFGVQKELIRNRKTLMRFFEAEEVNVH